MLILFHFNKSTCSQKVRLCLAELGLEWTGKHINLAAGEHLEPDYLSINPNGLVPALVHDGQVIVESSVICEYLCEAFSIASVLMPDNPVGRAKVRAWLRYIDEMPTASLRIPSFNKVIGLFQTFTEEEFEMYANRMPMRKHFFLKMGRQGFSRVETDKAIENLQKTVDRMETVLQTSRWLSGDAITLADICMTPIFVRMQDLDLDWIWAERPAVDSWFRAISVRSAFHATFDDDARFTF